MPRPTKIDRLPAEIRELIGRLRGDGRTIDEILGKLRELDVAVARSTLGEHIQRLDALGAQIQQSRAIAEALVSKFGDAPESRTARLNIELLHGQVMKLIAATGDPEKPLVLDPRDVNFLADALHRLARAARDDVEREAKLREMIFKQVRERGDKTLAAVAAEAAANPKLSMKDVLARIRRDVYGIEQ